MVKIYNIKRGVSGVYLITNKLNGFRYVGSSVDISGRLSTHFGRCVKQYAHLQMYKDIAKYGRDSFEWKVLEECPKENLIKREQHYYDVLQPEYNLVRPTDIHVNDPLIRSLAKKVVCSEEFRTKKKEQYNSPEYKKLFSDIQNKRKKKVLMYKNDVFIKEFESFMEAQRWLNENTKFSSKNKATKVKAVCDKERKIAFGYYFEYKKDL